MLLYHAITCDEDECDPPRTVDNAPRLPVVLDGCPIGAPWVRGPVRVEVRYSPDGHAGAHLRQYEVNLYCD